MGKETNPRALSEEIKQAAAGLGFDACGVASAEKAIDPDDRLGDWLARGYHGDMAWMADTQAVRQDVQRKLPGTRSVVVVARDYYSERPPMPKNVGRVSRYAWGRDYHRVLHKPLRKLAHAIETLAPGSATYCCIDTGPVLEKFWAVRAGIGWTGKNSLVLRRDRGSWFFLGVILTTAVIEPDQPVQEGCGSCRLCMDACPTQAIVAPRMVDSTLCISYHTIENRGDIPREIQASSGDWLFGCDICQEVCPWNMKARVTGELDFHARPGHAGMDLDAIEDLTEDSFREEFSGTPVMRAKLKGLQRNARIVRRNTEHGKDGDTPDEP